ncbi:MAG: hypothetical protein QW529_05580 [Sulfolobales archaeon]
MLVSRELSGGYLDELYYIEFGLKYVRCVLPAYFNPEHPPLGKYLIGALSVLNPRVVPALFGVLATIILAISIQKLRGSSLIAALAVAVLVSEVGFVKTFNYALLDSIAVGFASVATYFSMFYSKPAVSGLLWGAALASKLSTAYPFLGVLLFRLWGRRYRDALVEVLTAGVVYVVSFSGDLLCPGGSFSLFISHLLYVPTYMVMVHGLSVYKVVQGLSVALLKLGFWSSHPPLTVTVMPNATTEVALALGSASGLEVHFYFWLSGFLVPSSTALLSYALLKFKSFSAEAKLVTIVTLLSYVNVLHGAVFWYLTLPAYYLALLTGLILSRRTLLVLAVANLASLLLVFALGLTDTVVINI